MTLADTWLKGSQELLPETVALRRKIHEYPELGLHLPKTVSAVREALASLERSSDLIQLGAYVEGSNPLLDNALRNKPRIDSFLRQDAEETSSMEDTLGQLQSLASILQPGSLVRQ